MSPIKVDKLTPEEKASIAVYQKKWREIALSTERIDRDKAAEAIKSIYTSYLMKLPEPEIYFFDSPYAALIQLEQWELEAKKLEKKYKTKINNFPCRDRDNNLVMCFLIASGIRPGIIIDIKQDPDLFNKLSGYGHKVMNRFRPPINSQLADLLEIKIHRDVLHRPIFHLLESLHENIGLMDFYISVKNYIHDTQTWERLQELLKNSGWIVLFKEVCWICDRPTKVFFDNQNRLHAEGEPAIQYVDGFNLYSYHGVTLPEKYEKIHLDRWQSQWLLSEKNAELRRVLIQEIGYSRICQELKAIVLDDWQEYTLLKIENEIDLEPIFLLKMTCPSTGHIHVLRVPPNMQTAKEAIRWINWDIDPEEFFIQT